MKKMMKLFLMATMVFSVAMTFSSCSSDDDAPMALTTNDKLVDMIVGTWTVEPGYYETNNTYTYAVSHMTVTASRQAIDNTDQTAYTIRVSIGTDAVSITYDVATQSEQRITTPYEYSWSKTFLENPDGLANALGVTQLGTFYYRLVTDNSFQFSKDGVKWYTATRDGHTVD